MSWRRFFRRRKWDEERARELASYLETETEENIARGMTREEASRAAHIKLGNAARIREEIYEMNSIGFLETLWQDLRYGARVLRKSPGFTIVAILTLALGIGANTTIFTVAEAYFLRPLPGSDPAQLVTFTSKTPEGQDDDFSLPELRDIAEESSAFSGILAHSGHAGFLEVHGNSRLIAVDVVSRNYFDVLGVHAIRGRTFAVSPGHLSERSIILSYAVWQDEFGRDSDLIGKNIVLTGKSYAVVGVAPRSFRGLRRFVPTDAWLPLDVWYGASETNSRSFRDFQLVGRLGTDADAAQAQAQLTAISSRLATAYPATNAGRTFRLISERERLRKAFVPSGFLLTVTGLVLLIACANVAGLLVAKSESRRREMAIRLAIGAGRWRLVRQLLTESVMLGGAGAALAVLFSAWLIRLQPAFLPPAPFQVGADLRIDAPVAVFTVVVALLAVLISGLTPAMAALKVNVVPALKSDGGRTAGRSGRHNLRSVFIIGEVALAVVLLSGAGLLLRSLLLTLHKNLGFNSREKLLLVDLAPGVAGLNPQQSSKYFEHISPEVAALPGVKDITFALRAPLGESGGGRTAPVSIPGVVFPQAQPTIDIKFNSVASGYFRIVGTTRLKGRSFSPSDTADAPKVVIVDETMARRFWPNGNAIGRTIEVHGTQFQVIGIVENAKINDVHELAEPYMYFPFSQMPDSEATLIVETTQAPSAVAPAVRSKLRSLNSGVPIVDMMTMSQLMQDALWNDRMAADLVAGLSALGMFLAAVGLYGMIAYLVTGRTHEIGIRMALGAQRGQILRLVVGQGLKLAAFGAGAGLLLALATTRLMASLLYGVSPRDPAALAVACLLALAVALAACYIPARRATGVDPVIALRHE